MNRKADVEALLREINAELGGRVVVQRGSEIGWQSAERLLTGSLGLDIAMNGGLPRGMITQFMGEEASGKTTMALKCAGIVQDTFGEEAAIAFVAVEPFDKRWANQCGCAIPFTKPELKLMSADDAAVYKQVEDVGAFVVGQATTGEDALELGLTFIKSNRFQLVIIDSMAALVPAAEEEKEMAENTMGQLPRLIGKFLRKCYAAFNTAEEDGSPNQTAVLLINQVREVIGTYGHPEPQAPGGRGLRHALACNVRFKRGDLLKEGERGSQLIYGKRTKIRIEKNKVGPPFREAEFDFYFQPYGIFQPGDIDTVQETRIWAVKAGLIAQTGNSSYEFGGKKFKGRESMESWLRDHESECDDLREQVRALLTTSVGR